MAEQTMKKSNGGASDSSEKGSSHQTLEAFNVDELSDRRASTPVRPAPDNSKFKVSHEKEGHRRDSAEIKIQSRLKGLESQNRRLRFLVFTAYLLCGFVLYLQFSPTHSVVEEKRTQSKEVLLVDNSGLARMHLRMYSDRPVLQLLDSNGTPRLSLGMRFDEAPFIDFSDKAGRTRATFNMSELDEPAIRLYDENGEPSFTLN